MNTLNLLDMAVNLHLQVSHVSFHQDLFLFMLQDLMKNSFTLSIAFQTTFTGSFSPTCNLSHQQKNRYHFLGFVFIRTVYQISLTSSFSFANILSHLQRILCLLLTFLLQFPFFQVLSNCQAQSETIKLMVDCPSLFMQFCQVVDSPLLLLYYKPHPL